MPLPQPYWVSMPAAFWVGNMSGGQLVGIAVPDGGQIPKQVHCQHFLLISLLHHAQASSLSDLGPWGMVLSHWSIAKLLGELTARWRAVHFPASSLHWGYRCFLMDWLNWVIDLFILSFRNNARIFHLLKQTLGKVFVFQLFQITQDNNNSSPECWR